MGKVQGSVVRFLRGVWRRRALWVCAAQCNPFPGRRACQSDSHPVRAASTWQWPLAPGGCQSPHKSHLERVLRLTQVGGTRVACSRASRARQGKTERSAMKIQPLADRVVIRRFEAEEKT